MPSPTKGSPNSSRGDFSKAASGASVSSSKGSTQHQPLAVPALQPKGMGESTVNRDAHYKKQSETARAAQPQKSSRNNAVKEKRAAKAFAMVASKDGVIRSDNSKER